MTQYTPPRGYVTEGTPAWQSLPTAVRFAVWVWTVFVIAGVVGSAIGAVIWFVVLAAALGQQ